MIDKEKDLLYSLPVVILRRFNHQRRMLNKVHNVVFNTKIRRQYASVSDVTSTLFDMQYC